MTESRPKLFLLALFFGGSVAAIGMKAINEEYSYRLGQRGYTVSDTYRFRAPEPRQYSGVQPRYDPRQAGAARARFNPSGFQGEPQARSRFLAPERASRPVQEPEESLSSRDRAELSTLLEEIVE